MPVWRSPGCERLRLSSASASPSSSPDTGNALCLANASRLPSRTVAFANSEPTRRQLNDGWPFAATDQPQQRQQRDGIERRELLERVNALSTCRPTTA